MPNKMQLGAGRVFVSLFVVMILFGCLVLETWSHYVLRVGLPEL